MVLAAALHFISQQQQTGQAAIVTSWVELLTISALVSYAIAWYRGSRCHNTDCRREWRGIKLPFRRRGKYPHGHYKLCAKHHPNVPSSGKITAAHITAQTHDGH